MDLGRGEDGRRLRRVVYGATRAAVSTKLNSLLGRSVSGELLVTSTPTLAAWLDTWYQAHRRDWRGSTPRIYRTAIDEWLTPMLGKVRLEALKPVLIQKWVNAATKDGARSHVVLAHCVLRSALQFAMQQRLITFNAAELARVPRPEKKPITPLTAEEAGRLVDAAKAHRLGALVVTTLGLGLRIGEATGLAWTDVDLDARTVQVRRQLQSMRAEGADAGTPQALTLVPLKTAASRRGLSLPMLLVETLQNHRRQQLVDRLRAGADWENSDNLVFTMSNGAPLAPSHVRRAFAAMLRRANISAMRFHGLRHSAATLLLAGGAQLVDISKALGHAGIQITSDTYSHFVPAIAEGVALRMDAVLKTGSKA